MDWMQFTLFLVAIIGMFLTIVGMFVWNRTESRTDIRHMDAKLESTRELVRAIHDEMKDFHARLIAIEKTR